MKFDEFQEKAVASAARPDLINEMIYPALGVGGEAHEVVKEVLAMWQGGEWKIFKGYRSCLVDELGDTLWYLACFAHSLGISLEEAVDTMGRDKDDTFGSFQFEHWESGGNLGVATLMFCAGAGAVQEQVKKLVRDGGSNSLTMERRDKIMRAITDCLVGAANVSSHAGVSFDQVAERGIEKSLECRERILKSRKKA